MTSPDRRAAVRIALALLLAVAAGAAFAGGLDSMLSLAWLKAQQGALAERYAAHPAAFVAGFVGLQAAALALCVPGAVLLFALAAGAVLGTATGTLVVLAAVTLGDSLGFLTARYLLRDWAERRFARQHARFAAGLARGGASYLLALRLLAVVPYAVVNIAMALTRMRLRVFAPVSFVGLIPATLLHVNAGTQLGRIERAGDVLTWPVLVAFGALAVFPLLVRALLGRQRADG